MPPPVMPSENLDWNDSLSNVIDPPAGLKTTGYLPAEVPASQHHNWIFNLIDQWIKWLTYQVTVVVPTTGLGTRGYTPVAFADTPFAITSAHNGKTLEVDSSGGAIELDLPDPLLNDAMVLTILDSTGNFGINNVTLKRFGIEFFEGLQADYVFAAPWGRWSIMASNGNWYFMA